MCILVPEGHLSAAGPPNIPAMIDILPHEREIVWMGMVGKLMYCCLKLAAAF
jgi:hypothetical protein